LALRRIEAVGYQRFQMLREVARDELDLSCQFDVLLVNVVTVEAFKAVDVRLYADRE